MIRLPSTLPAGVGIVAEIAVFCLRTAIAFPCAFRAA